MREALPGDVVTVVTYWQAQDLTTINLSLQKPNGDIVARAAAFEAYDGLGLLVFQARRSLALWTARPVPVDPLARAVGWPR